MDRPVLYIMCAFFLVGGIDFIFGSRLGLGNKFADGVRAMGTLALGIIGIYTLSPFLLTVLSPAAEAVSALLRIDPSVLPACIFPVDMGGYPISVNLAENAAIGRFSGVIIASALGATVSFSIPVAGGFIRPENSARFAEGLVIGIISIVPGCFLAGIAGGIPAWTLLWNMLPLFVIVALLSFGLLKAPGGTIRGFIVFGKLVTALGVVGLLFQGLYVLAGIRILPEMTAFSDTAVIVGRIALVLAGAYPLMEILNRLLKKSFSGIGAFLGVNAPSVAAAVGNLASNLLVFGTFDDLDERGKVLCTSLAVSGAFVLGGQFAYVASVEPGMVGPYFVSKFGSGAISVLIFLFLRRRAMKTEG